jgi:protein phosphatase
MTIQPCDSGYHSDKGPYRPRNEDVALADSASGIFILADGLGGAAAGDRAARIAADSLSLALLDQGPPKALPRKLLPEGVSRQVLEAMLPAGETEPTEHLRFAYLLTHYRVLAEARDSGQVGMAAAVVNAWLCGDTAWIGHVGDCRAYALEGDTLTTLTRDHSLSMALAGRVDVPEGSLNNPFMRSRLTQVVGGENAPTPDIREWRPVSGARLLLCSDGVWGSLDDEVIQQCLIACSSAQDSCRRLVEAALGAGSRDNATAMVVFFGE